MSKSGTKRPRGPGIVRRGVRKPTVIELPAQARRPEPPHASRHAKIFVAALTAIILGGTALLVSPWTSANGEWTPFVDALFTAVSAVSVTGLVVVDTATYWNFLGEVVILVLIQIGGLGFMVGASIVLQVLRRGSSRLSDVLLVREGAPAMSLRDAAVLSRRIVIFTFITEAAGAVVLTLCFWPHMAPADALWFGVFHSVAAFCNAGFDLQGRFVSLIPYQTAIGLNVAIILLIQLGAVSYIVFADVVTCRQWRKFSIDSKLVLLLNGIVLVVGTAVFLIVEWGGALAETPIAARPLVAVFQSVAARTAGFATVSFGDVQAVTLFIWMALMLIGGASGSTAGGVKLTTVGVVAAALVSTLRGREETQVFRRRISTPLVFQAMAVIAVMLAVHFTATAVLASTQGWFRGEEVLFVALMFETMSALATVGLSTGVTPTLTDVGKLILCVVMFFGRLGPLTVVYALQRRQRPARLRFPTAPVRIG